MNKLLFHPGDIIANVNFSPVTGHEQAKIRPALIVSSADYQRLTGLCVVVPISSNTKPYPMHVPLDERTSTYGCIYAEHPRAMDLVARQAVKKEECPQDILDEVLKRVALIFPNTSYDID
ncbi:type II toxin-antitoxin system PemK/MazF family toxin [Faecalibaculum rodentium]|uniref:type II toxin-antitoxin system PemK/MazF family toxin n=2 Tax=Faecalibaculum rodentium TaxID=1702221 RepID=UPI0025B7A6CE|nr:type II toxin-antitoxin system PemK/MazF family toxin [Faecalibaculum rodentium]